MKAVLFVAVCCAAYYAQAQAYFSESNVQQWLADHSSKALQGDVQACEDFADNVRATLEAEHGVVWQVTGGKAEMCHYLRQSASILAATKPQTRIEQVRIEPTGFPWLAATVSYVEHTQVQGNKQAATQEFASSNQVVISRTLSGLKIVSLVAKGAS